MSKYTPGPWNIKRDERDEEPHDPIEIFAGRYCVACAIADDRHYDAFGDDDVFLPMVEANAQLIAAAPDLLEACKLAEANLTAQDDVEKLILRTEIVLRFVRLAIAKAEGRS